LRRFLAMRVSEYSEEANFPRPESTRQIEGKTTSKDRQMLAHAELT